MAHSLPSPLRLFTPSDMVLGRYGTAVCIDAQTDPNSPSQAGDHGQRIVGMVLSDPLADPAAYVTTQGDDRVSPGHLNAGVDAHGNEHGGEHGTRTTPMMQFHLQLRADGWSRLALDEEEGRIAVGSVDGKVTVFEYLSQHES